MSQCSHIFRVRIRGPMACFTRPELKTERVSYDVMTPSAARGVLEAILWKPAIRWRIHRIHVLAPIRFSQIRRNEVNSKLSDRANFTAYCADEDRAQRNTLFLRDVDYVVEASFEMTNRAGEGDNLIKFSEMFQRRLEKGQRFQQPYLGCREFAATVEPAPEQWETPESLNGSLDLGVMLHDMEFDPKGGPARPRFFRALLQDGVMDIGEVLP